VPYAFLFFTFMFVSGGKWQRAISARPVAHAWMPGRAFVGTVVRGCLPAFQYLLPKKFHLSRVPQKKTQPERSMQQRVGMLNRRRGQMI